MWHRVHSLDETWIFLVIAPGRAIVALRVDGERMVSSPRPNAHIARAAAEIPACEAFGGGCRDRVRACKNPRGSTVMTPPRDGTRIPHADVGVEDLCHAKHLTHVHHLAHVPTTKIIIEEIPWAMPNIRGESLVHVRHLRHIPMRETTDGPRDSSGIFREERETRQTTCVPRVQSSDMKVTPRLCEHVCHIRDGADVPSSNVECAVETLKRPV